MTHGTVTAVVVVVVGLLYREQNTMAHRILPVLSAIILFDCRNDTLTGTHRSRNNESVGSGSTSLATATRDIVRDIWSFADADQ
jgi:hypothetical protein